MAGESYSPNMNLVLPGVGVTAGPVYASDLNQSLNILDQHNHAPGSGVQITPDGLNINSNFTMNNNNIIAIKSLRLQDQVSALSGGSDLGCIYRVVDDLYYNDGLGNQIRLTQSGSVAGTSGSIANLVSPASATFVSLSSTIVFQSDVNTAASLDAGSLLLRNITASSKALTLSPPAAMASDYSITLPSLPSSQKIMTLDASGNISAPYVVDNSTIEISSNTIRVKDGGITYAKMGAANAASTTIPDTGINNPVAFTEYLITTLSSITTTGRPVMLSFGVSGVIKRITAGASSLSNNANSVGIVIKRNGTTISVRAHEVKIASGGGIPEYIIAPSCSFNCIDLPSAGTHTYSFYIYTENGATGAATDFIQIDATTISAIGL